MTLTVPDGTPERAKVTLKSTVNVLPDCDQDVIASLTKFTDPEVMPSVRFRLLTDVAVIPEGRVNVAMPGSVDVPDAIICHEFVLDPADVAVYVMTGDNASIEYVVELLEIVPEIVIATVYEIVTVL
jgi:hypothetical protein